MIWLLWLGACGPKVECSPGAWYADQDGDGYGAGPAQVCTGVGQSQASGDCDDEAPSVHPGAAELPADGVDSDCDGLELCEEDQDGDGYGSGQRHHSEALDCIPLGELVDCDDLDAQVYPGATEQPADGLDSDCDGLELCYEDLDGDGVGSELTLPSARLLCQDPGMVSITGDCDDSQSEVHPFASESPMDGVDSDCDGLELCYMDLDEDGWGVPETHLSESIACAGPQDGQHRYDCDDTEALVNPGLSEICGDGLDNDCSGEFKDCGPYGTLLTDAADLLFWGELGQSAGIHLLADDLSGNGQVDLLIGSIGENEAGAAYLHQGPLSASAAVESEASLSLWASNPIGLLGRPSASGDLNGDGQADLLLYGFDPPYTDAYGDGSIYLLFGPLTASRAADTHQGHDWWSQGSDGARHGSAMVVADLDNDGVDDLIAGAPADSVAAYRAGASSLFYGPISAPTLVHGGVPDLKWTGDTEDQIGESLASGDLDGDGLADLVIGAPEDSGGAGSVFVLYGPPKQGAVKLVADMQIYGSSSEEVGAELRIADWSGDGQAQLAVGAPGYSTETGRVYLLDSPSAGQIASVASASLTGAGAGSSVGAVMSTGCDVDGDGSPDLLIGSQASGKAGTATLVLGAPWSGALDLESEAATVVRERSGASDTGRTVLCMPDTNGDGFGELVVGSPEALEGSGLVSLWFGGGP